MATLTVGDAIRHQRRELWRIARLLNLNLRSLYQPGQRKKKPRGHRSKQRNASDRMKMEVWVNANLRFLLYHGRPVPTPDEVMQRLFGRW